MMKAKTVCVITMLIAVPAVAEIKSPPIRQELVHEYARKQIPLARAAHAATYACHEVTSDCDFARDMRNTERCHNAERIVPLSVHRLSRPCGKPRGGRKGSRLCSYTGGKEWLDSLLDGSSVSREAPAPF